MLFLHGAGERGDNLELVKVWGPSKLVLAKPDFPFVLVSPQCPAGERWNVDHLDQLLDYAITQYNVDPERVYVTGLSMGGQGTWALVAKSPHKIAAAIPICGGGDPATAAALIDVPIWAFHGDADEVVNIEQSRRMMSAILAKGGKKFHMTTYAGVGHNSWSPTYANPQIYEWLLSKRRQK
jgi:predicted peptidase